MYIIIFIIEHLEIIIFYITSTQYGFKQGHCSETQLSTVVEDILYAMDHHQHAGWFDAYQFLQSIWYCPRL